jgi:hypothetical protein
VEPEYSEEYQAWLVQQNLKDLAKDPDASKKWMIEVGLLNKDGELPERFR